MRPILVTLALVSCACQGNDSLIVRVPAEAERFWVAVLAPTGVIDLPSNGRDQPFESPVPPENRLLLVSLGTLAISALHPRVVSDLAQVELVLDADPSSCEMRFDGRDAIEVPAANIATLQEVDLELGTLGPPSLSWAAQMPRLRLRVPLETAGCPDTGGPATLVADLSGHPDVSTEDGLEVRFGAYVDERHFALMSATHVFILDRDAPSAPRVDWVVPENAPRAIANARYGQTYAPIAPSSSGGARALSIMGYFSGRGIIEEPALIELELRPDAVIARLGHALDGVEKRLVAREDGAWAAVGEQRVFTATGSDEGARLHTLDLAWEPKTLSLRDSGETELMLASGNRILLSPLAPPTAANSVLFDELEETGTLAIGGTADGSASYFSSRAALYQRVGTQWIPASFALDNDNQCPVLDRDECGRFGPSGGLEQIVAGPTGTVLFLVNDCSGAVLYDPVLDCGAVPVLEGGSGNLNVKSAAVFRDRVLLVEKHGQSYELRVSPEP